MTIFRSKHLFVVAAATAAIAACDPPEPKAPANSLAAILEEPDSRTLSDGLGRFIEARHADPDGLDRELLAGGFERLKAGPGCTRFAYEGDRKQLLPVDRRLRIRITLCGSNPRKQTISVRRGND
jgi:hypothetical protein